MHIRMSYSEEDFKSDVGIPQSLVTGWEKSKFPVCGITTG